MTVSSLRTVSSLCSQVVRQHPINLHYKGGALTVAYIGFQIIIFLFICCPTILLVAWTVQCRMIGLLVNSEMERVLSQLSWYNLKYFSSIFLKGVGKITKWSVMYVCRSQDSNWAPRGYKSGAIPFVSSSLINLCHYVGSQ